MMTFTSTDERPYNAPSMSYLDVMRRGMREAYPLLCNEQISESIITACSSRTAE